MCQGFEFECQIPGFMNFIGVSTKCFQAVMRCELVQVGETSCVLHFASAKVIPAHPACTRVVICLFECLFSNDCAGSY